jgi:hypothetical protein
MASADGKAAAVRTALVLAAGVTLGAAVAYAVLSRSAQPVPAPAKVSARPARSGARSTLAAAHGARWQRR